MFIVIDIIFSNEHFGFGRFSVETNSQRPLCGPYLLPFGRLTASLTVRQVLAIFAMGRISYLYRGCFYIVVYAPTFP